MQNPSASRSPAANDTAYAHSHPDQGEGERLEEHLAEVANLAGEMARAFGAESWARVAGLWHDIGKYAPEFQAYMRASSAGEVARGAGPTHAQAGALHAWRRFGEFGKAIAFMIAGHHAGLPDHTGPSDACLNRSLQGPRPESEAALRHAPADILLQDRPAIPARFAAPDGSPLRASLFIRMVFSCLIDADRLATERFGRPEQADARSGWSLIPDQAKADVIMALRASLDARIAALSARTSCSEKVANVRAELLRACRERAALPPGLFSLTAPTGSGKTLSSMAFALRHAELHGMRRIVYALPFTSVTEQNADEFRKALKSAGERVVLEHHSAAALSPDEEQSPDQLWRRLAVENWDAPVIVTTNVQLFESLFSAGPSRCRKLHHLAGSVIVLDEAQTLPVHLLKPTLAALRELAACYHVSIVFCSATMPAVVRRGDFDIGLENVREIVPDPERMARGMRRAEIRRVGVQTDDQLAERIAQAPAALTIVNTRRHAARLYAMAKNRVHGEGEVLHLSALMCPEHRARRVAEIKTRLAQHLPCRVVSTQVVEAGVDIDFPLVLRAMAGLDSIIQAAGRCNREGRLDRGEVLVFDTDEKPPPSILRAAGHTREVLQDGVDPLDLDTIESYFRLHYWSRASEWDGGPGVRISELLRQLLFRQAQEAYRMIDEAASTQVVVPYGEEGRRLCEQLARDQRPSRDVLRRAQRYSVNAPVWSVREAAARGVCVESPAGVVLLSDEHHYRDDIGLVLEGQPEPEGLIG